MTGLLFTIGKTAIGVYIGTTHIASGFGAAGALIVMLVWIYYSSLIFLLGAEFTRAYAQLRSTQAEQGGRSHSDHIAAPLKPHPGPARILPPGSCRCAPNSPTPNSMRRGGYNARIPNRTLPDETACRPSLLQIAVATLAMLTLPPKLRSEIHQPISRRLGDATLTGPAALSPPCGPAE